MLRPCARYSSSGPTSDVTSNRVYQPHSHRPMPTTQQKRHDDHITKTVLIAKNTGIPGTPAFGLIITGSFQTDRDMFCLHRSSDHDSSSSGRPSPPSCGLDCPPSETFLAQSTRHP